MAKAETYDLESSSSGSGSGSSGEQRNAANSGSDQNDTNYIGGNGSSDGRGDRHSAAPARHDNAEQHGLLSTTGAIDLSDDDHDAISDENNGYVVRPGDSDSPIRLNKNSSRNENGNGNGNGNANGLVPSTRPMLKTGRTVSRVRFDLRPTNIPPLPANGHDLDHDRERERDYIDPRDFLGSLLGSPIDNDDSPRDDRRASRDDFEPFDLDDEDFDPSSSSTPGRGARRPLLTDIEAPAVALANDAQLWGEHGGDAAVEEAWADQSRPKSGLRPAFMNMANSIIGAGIIGQPYALRQAGLLAGIVLLLVLTGVVDWTIRLIVINSKLSGAGSFQGTVEHCFGRPGLIAISLAQWLFAFGGMVAFGVIVGDSIPQVLRAIWPELPDVPVLGLLADRRAVIVVFVLGVSYPLTLYRDIAKLAKASTLALISMVVILVTVIVQGFLAPAESRGSLSTPELTVNSGIFQAIGVISFAFVCHHNSLLIYGSLKTPTMDRFATVTHYSVGVSTAACLAMGLAGFLTFGDRTAGNVLNNFAADNTMVTLARLCFGLNMLTTLPLEAFVCREVMLNYYFPGEPFNMNLHLILSSALIVSAMTVSLLTCDVGAVFDLVGATSACALAYVLPPLCFIRLSSRRGWSTVAAWAVVAFGLAVMCISVLQAGYKMISGEGDPVKCV